MHGMMSLSSGVLCLDGVAATNEVKDTRSKKVVERFILVQRGGKDLKRRGFNVEAMRSLTFIRNVTITRKRTMKSDVDVISHFYRSYVVCVEENYAANSDTDFVVDKDG